MLRFDRGAKGMLWCSQVAPSHENGLRIRVYGSKGGSNEPRQIQAIFGSRPLVKQSA